MSTKKQLRLERQKKRQDEVAKTRSSLRGVLIFILSITAILVGIVLYGTFLGDNPEPPWPGATWSAAHGHWH